MAYYLGRERAEDVSGAYRRYQNYLQQNKEQFPAGAFSLATATWYQNAGDHRCPHDAALVTLNISELPGATSKSGRNTQIRMRLLGRYGDGHIEFFYPRVRRYDILCDGHICGLGGWCYDEFTLSHLGDVMHTIEWHGFGDDGGSRWVIEASDVEYLWHPLDSKEVPS